MTNIKLVDLRKQFEPYKAEILTQVEHVLDGMQLFLGENTFRLETEFAQFCQARYAVGVGSGTDALYLALRACDIGPGDEVITVPNTFIATASAIALAGARPVFIDIDPSTYTMDTELLEAAITPRTKAVVPVHLYGHTVDMGPVLRVAHKHGLRVIEDACQAHGAEYQGRRTGTLGDVAAFSFYYAKNLGAYGEAGIVVTNDRAIQTRVQMLRNHGSKDRYEHVELGMNSRLDEIQAAILRVKLPHLEEANTRRRALASEYALRLADTPDVHLPEEQAYARHVYHLFVIEAPRRDALRDWLRERGVETGVHYPVPLHLQEACAHLGYRAGDFPNAEAAAKRILSLPMYPELTVDQVSYVCQSVHDFYQRPHHKGKQKIKAGFFMIPEQYWQLLRRWFWLIGTFGIAGAALAIMGMPYLLGSTSSHDASATIVVSHYVSPTRIVTTDQGDTDNAVVADYTRAIALYADTPQFVESVRQRLAAEGITASSSAIKGQLRIEAAPELFRINVHAAGGDSAATQAMVTAGADVLIKRAEDEEARVAFGLIANLDQQREQLIARLDELSKQRVTILKRVLSGANPSLNDRPEVNRIRENAPLLVSGAALSTEMDELISAVAQIIGDPELISVDVELTTVQAQLETLTAQREAVLSNRVYSAPITLLNPAEIVQTQADALPGRDLAILGGAAGAVVGWAVINLLDRMRTKRRGKAPAPLRVIDATPALAAVSVEPDARLRALIERSAEVERRARALAAATAATNGREALAAGRE